MILLKESAKNLRNSDSDNQRPNKTKKQLGREGGKKQTNKDRIKRKKSFENFKCQKCTGKAKNKFSK